MKTCNKTGSMSVGRTMLIILIVCFGMALPLWAGDVVKENNMDNLNLGASWMGGVAPGVGDIAVWSNNLAVVNTTNALGADVSWLGMNVKGALNIIKINAGNKLTLGSGGITNSTTQQVALDCQVELSADQIWNVNRFFWVNGVVYATNRSLMLSGGSGVLFGSTGGSSLAGFIGTITSSGGGIYLYANAGSTTNIKYVLNSGVMGLRSGTAVLGSLDGAGGSSLGNWATQNGAGLFEVGGANTDATFHGTIMNGGSATPRVNSIRKVGSGTWTLSGTNTYSGGTTVSNGFIVIDNDQALGTGPASLMGGGLSVTNGSRVTTNVVNLVNNAILNVNNGAEWSIAAAITNTGGLVKAGEGRLILAGTNTYSGSTTVSNGVLLINGSTASTVTLSGGTVGGGGTVIGNVAVGASGGIYAALLDGSGSSESLLVDGNVDLNSIGSRLELSNTNYLFESRARYTVLSCTNGTLSGVFKSSNLPDNWRIMYELTAGRGRVTIAWAPSATVICIH